MPAFFVYICSSDRLNPHTRTDIFQPEYLRFQML